MVWGNKEVFVPGGAGEAPGGWVVPQQPTCPQHARGQPSTLTFTNKYSTGLCTAAAADPEATGGQRSFSAPMSMENPGKCI